MGARPAGPWIKEITAGPPLPLSVPIHSSPGLTTPVPSEVAKTVVAASEPRLPSDGYRGGDAAGGAVLEAIDGAGEVLAADGRAR